MGANDLFVLHVKQADEIILSTIEEVLSALRSKSAQSWSSVGRIHQFCFPQANSFLTIVLAYLTSCGAPTLH